MTSPSVLIDFALNALIASTAAIGVYKFFQLYISSRTRKLMQDGVPYIDIPEREAELEFLMPALSVIASCATLVGLAGTVVHIIAALQGINGSILDITVISGPVAMSLYATLKGLASAIPAAALFTLYASRVSRVMLKAKSAHPLPDYEEQAHAAV